MKNWAMRVGLMSLEKNEFRIFLPSYPVQYPQTLDVPGSRTVGLEISFLSIWCSARESQNRPEEAFQTKLI